MTRLMSKSEGGRLLLPYLYWVCFENRSVLFDTGLHQAAVRKLFTYKSKQKLNESFELTRTHATKV